MNLTMHLGHIVLPLNFLPCCLEVINADMMRTFTCFDEGSLMYNAWTTGLSLCSLRYLMLIRRNSVECKLICLLRCIYKIITKVLAILLEPFVDNLFSIYQNAFTVVILWNGIMALHELLRHSYVKNKPTVAPKLDFEKAYSKVNWEFLLDCHAMGGFW